MYSIEKLTYSPEADSDLSFLVDLHVNAVPDDYMPRLGAEFLKKTFYNNAINSRYASIAICRDGKQIAGYIFYTYDGNKFYREMLANNFGFISIYFFKQLFLNPRIIYDTLRIFGHLLFSAQTGSEIMMIVVSGKYRGQKIGDKLVQVMFDDLKSKKVKTCTLRVLKDNVSAIRLYEKTGWEFLSEITFLNRKWHNMKKEI